MRRGTTPFNTFDLTAPDGTAIDASTIADCYITYQQKGKTVIEKRLADCEVGESSLSVPITQEDTLALNAKYPVRIQIRALFTDGSIDASSIIEASVGDILKDGPLWVSE